MAFRILGFVVTSFVLAMVIFVSVSFTMDSALKENQKALEKAYFEGQKDYAEGKTHISKSSGSWTWLSSPWDDNRPAIYQP